MKERKPNRIKKQDKKARKKITKHHLINKSRGGGNQPWNILMLEIEKHQAWHKLFGNLNLDEAIDLLQRIKRAKAQQNLD